MKKRILIADDDESVRRMVARVLESADYNVTLAGSDVEVVSRAPAPHLLLLDLKRPDQASWAVIDQIGRLNTSAPIIVTSAWPNQSEVARDHGVAALMEKPLDPTVLLKSIQTLLEVSERRATEPVVNPGVLAGLLTQAT